MTDHKSSTITEMKEDHHRTAKTSFASPGMQPPPANVIKSFLNHRIAVSHVNFIIWHIRFWGSGWIARHASKKELEVITRQQRRPLPVLVGFVWFSDDDN